MNCLRQTVARYTTRHYKWPATLAVVAILAVTPAVEAQLYGFWKMQNGTPVNGVTVNVTEEGVNPDNENVRVHSTVRNFVNSDATRQTRLKTPSDFTGTAL